MGKRGVHADADYAANGQIRYKRCMLEHRVVCLFNPLQQSLDV